jgi:hypothetical protein
MRLPDFSKREKMIRAVTVTMGEPAGDRLPQTLPKDSQVVEGGGRVLSGGR